MFFEFFTTEINLTSISGRSTYVNSKQSNIGTKQSIENLHYTTRKREISSTTGPQPVPLELPKPIRVICEVAVKV
jgi:hypothetical protein